MNSILPAPVNYQVSALMGKRILVVDDDEAMLTAVSKVLRHAGAAVESASSVAESIAQMEETDAEFDAVLTDLRMPVASGKTVLSAIKSLHPGVPVVMMSGYWTEEMKDECALLGSTQFLDKPLNSSHLLITVTRALLAGLALRESVSTRHPKGTTPAR
jgi:DNA-binding NtrC family response regulator